MKAKAKGKKNSYMKTKKALAGLLGLLGSFAAFPFLPAGALVEAPPFFTEGLQQHTQIHTKINNTNNIYKNTESNFGQFLDLRSDKTWSKSFHRMLGLKIREKKENSLGFSFLRLRPRLCSFHGESCKIKIGSVRTAAEIERSTRKLVENRSEKVDSPGGFGELGLGLGFGRKVFFNA